MLWRTIELLLVVLAATCSQAAPLQLAQLDHTSWTSRDGAPLHIREIQQDKDGTLWLVAESGLYNFNGISFTPFQFQPNELQLPHSMCADKSGVLWVGSSIKGIAEIRNHRVLHLYDETEGLPLGQVSQIVQESDGAILAVVRNHLVRLRSGRWEEPTAFSVLGSGVKRIFIDRKGDLWAATTTAVWELAAGQPQFRKIKEVHGLTAFFAEALDGSVWMQSVFPAPRPNITQRVKGGGGSYAASEPFQIDGVFVFFDWDGLLWMGSLEQGILRVVPKGTLEKGSDRHGSRAGFSVQKYGRLDGLTSGAVTTLMMDREGDIWVATATGLNRFRRPNLVRLIDKHIATLTVLAQCPGGFLWLAGSGFPPVTIRDGLVVEHGPKSEYAAAHCDAKNVAWLSTYSGILRYAGDQIQRIPPPAGLSPNSSRQIVGGGDRPIFVSITGNGLWQYSGETWSRVVAGGLANDTPFSLFMDSRGRLWTGYVDNRIAVLDGGVGRVFLGDSARPLGVIQVFLESRFGLLVGATNGIAVLQGDHLQTLQTVDQIAVRGVSGLLEASNGDLWSNGLHGIVRIPAHEVTEALRSPGYQMRSEIFSEAGIEGPSPQILEMPSAVKDSHGILWFVTSNEVVSIDPESIHASTTPPILTGISMTVDGTPLANNGQVPHGYHTVRIKYLGAYITAPEKVTYKYKLTGADEAWQDVGDRSEAVYTGLRPGAYRFAVTASNGEGTWSQPDESLQFTVQPSFYQRPAFLFLCAATLTTLFLLGLRARIRHVAARIGERAEVRADERVRIARDLHDTLLQGVQGLTLHFHVAAQQLPEGSQPRESMERALATADRILVEGRDRVTRLRADHLTHTDLADAFSAVATGLNDDQQVRFALKIEGPVEDVNPVVLHELYYIGREAITNAFRHSKASEIAVNLKCEPKSVVLAIADNGGGFDPLARETNPRAGHWGLIGMKERAETVGAHFECQSAENKGTKILVTVSGRRAYGKQSARGQS